jgi:molybdenum cofactor biosynthesis enzyme MoaA
MITTTDVAIPRPLRTASTHVEPTRRALKHPDTEPQVPTIVHTDRTLRVKVIDSCGMTCTFCHNEGTPVAMDNTRAAGQFTSGGASGRVSIYLATNGAAFVPTAVLPDSEFFGAVRALRDALDLDELHLTGGEPTLHPRLGEIVALGVRVGLRVSVTSNGERGARIMAACAQAGLDRINFSIFGTTAAELAQVQDARFADVRRAERKIMALKASIVAAERNGIRTNANVVVPSYGHAPRVLRLLEEFSPWLSVRLMNSLDEGSASINAIHRILADLGAEATANHVTAGASGSRTSYILPNGRTIWFKQIRSVRLPTTCAGCRFNNDKDCQEGFYGIRLYRDRCGTYQVGVCIQRMDLCMPVDEFVKHDLCREVLALRRAESRQLAGDRED